VTFDERTLRRVASAPAGDFPDGVAYESRRHLVFVSDVTGKQLVVFRARTGKRVGVVPLGGSPGNVQYDAHTGLVVAAVGSRDELAVISSRRMRVTRRLPLRGCDDPHGVEVVSSARRAYVACEQNAKLVVVDLAKLRQRAIFSVGAGPDVLDYDPGLRRLYVASESGVVSAFATSPRVRKLGESNVDPHAHTVAVDSKTHRVYFPLEDVGGRPVLRVMEPTHALAAR
jgi:DNA-binding beta-propeller fold protein YncE